MSVNREIRIASIGNVDSGKSTTISVLSHNILDNGRGKARESILKHPHEKTTGRTSSIAHTFIRKPNYIYNFIDLAGHEKYLKTTTMGLNGYLIDYAMVVIGADRGIIGMTKEHLILAISLKIPLFIVITKIDVAVERKLNNLEKRLSKIFSSKFAGEKELQFINNINDICSDKVPVFKISNVTGLNLDIFKNYIFTLPPLSNIGSKDDVETKFVIDARFRLPGIGLILTGICHQGTFYNNKKYFLGPFGSSFKQVYIRSIHNNFRENIDLLRAGEGGCFNIKFVNPKEKVHINDIRKGHIVLSKPNSIRTFQANIRILHHPTTIKVNYEPIVHCGIVRQVAKIINMDKELIRTGDSSLVTFKFKYRNEYIEKGSKITFREGRTKGVGFITDIIA